MIIRLVLVLLFLGGAGALASRAGSTEASVDRAPLRELSTRIGAWRGLDTEPFADDVLAQLGVDDYINRHYANPDTQALVAMYAGYYASQRQGDTIHSPQNCLPGAGWRPVEAGRITLTGAADPVEVNRYVIQKGLSRQVVLYWYQGRGRVVAGEYTNKALLMLDAARLGRSNGGLVRLMTPVVASPDEASTHLTSFATALLPHLSRHLP
jgi:EpsI family protein